jgi:hypothetical protein
LGRVNYHARTTKSTTDGEGSDQLPRTEGNSHPRHRGVGEAAWAWRLRPTVSVVCSFRLKDSSVTTVMLQMAFLGGFGIPPPSARERRGTTPQPPSGGEQCPASQRTSPDRLRVSAAYLHGKASGPINYHAPTAKSTTHGEGSDQPPGTEGNSHPLLTGVAEAAGAWRPGPKVYVVCSFRLKVSSVTPVMVQRALIWGGVIPHPWARGRLGTTLQPPPVGGNVIHPAPGGGTESRAAGARTVFRAAPGAVECPAPSPGTEVSRAAPGG